MKIIYRKTAYICSGWGSLPANDKVRIHQPLRLDVKIIEDSPRRTRHLPAGAGPPAGPHPALYILPGARRAPDRRHRILRHLPGDGPGSYGDICSGRRPAAANVGYLTDGVKQPAFGARSVEHRLFAVGEVFCRSQYAQQSSQNRAAFSASCRGVNSVNCCDICFV